MDRQVSAEPQSCWVHRALIWVTHGTQSQRPCWHHNHKDQSRQTVHRHWTSWLCGHDLVIASPVEKLSPSDTHRHISTVHSRWLALGHKQSALTRRLHTRGLHRDTDYINPHRLYPSPSSQQTKNGLWSAGSMNYIWAQSLPIMHNQQRGTHYLSICE